MKPAIVIVTKTTDEPCYFGPFPSGVEACHWAAINCRGFEWHWQELCLVNQPEEEEV